MSSASGEGAGLFQIESVAQLSELILSRDFGAAAGGAWFRGQRDAQWRLEPRLTRDIDIKREMEVTHEFEVRCAGILRRPFAEAWEVLCVAQHYDLPTRLLDWTSLAPVALFFATRGSKRGTLSIEDEATDGALFAFDPARHNRAHEYGDRVLTFGRDAMIDGTDHSLVGNQTRKTPFAVQAPFTFDRIASQEGRFVVCPPDGPLLDQFIADSVLEKWIVPGGRKRLIREELESLGFVESRIFPTLENHAREVAARLGGK